MKLRNGGFTLIEVIITFIIMSIFFLSFAALLMSSQQGWLRAHQFSALQDDYRYCRSRVEFQVRNATGPFVIVDSPAEKYFDFHKTDGKRIRYQVNARQWTEQRYGVSSYIPEGSEAIVLSNVDVWNVTQPVDGTFIFDIERTVDVSGRQIQKNEKFSVSCRNVRY